MTRHRLFRLQIIITLTPQTSHSTCSALLGPTDNWLALGDCRQRFLDAAFLRRWVLALEIVLARLRVRHLDYSGADDLHLLGNTQHCIGSV